MIITRFAPSPTGELHIGGLHTALFAWAYARKCKGKFILRIEDTDTKRSDSHFTEGILKAFDWLGIDYDDIYFQSRRTNRYLEVAQQLLDAGFAYKCYCSKERLDEMREKQRANGLKPKYDRYCLHNMTQNISKPYVIRFKNFDDGNVYWNDAIKGKITIANHELDDLIIVRSNNTPTYNFCVVVDDLDMQISHVIRGDDHISNTPRQINILKALNAKTPVYAHIPLLLNNQRRKLSKRDGQKGVMYYHLQGILGVGLINYLARLGWSHHNEELFSVQDFINWFDINDVSSVAAQFDYSKLLWFNKQHIMQSSAMLLFKLLKNELSEFDDYQNLKLLDVIDIVKLRVSNLVDLVSGVKIFYLPNVLTQEEEMLVKDNISLLQQLLDFGLLASEWEKENLEELIKLFCKNYQIKMNKVGTVIRLVLCGTKKTTTLSELLFVLGKDEVYKRFVRVLNRYVQ